MNNPNPSTAFMIILCYNPNDLLLTNFERLGKDYMSVKMLHTCIRVKDLEKSLKFYKEALDLIILRERDYPDYKFTLVYLSSKEGEYEIELTYNYDVEKPYEIGNGFSHVAVGTENLEEMRDKHIHLGYEVTDFKGLAGQTPSYYFVTDPDGYKIEVIRIKNAADYSENM